MLLSGRIINVYYTVTKNNFVLKFVLLVKNEKGIIQKIIVPWIPDIKPYFYCTGEAISFLKDCFGKIKSSCKIIPDNNVSAMQKGNDERIFKVIASTPNKIASIKRLNHWKNNYYYNNNHIFEGDVSYVLRYLIDKNITSWVQFDLEKKMIKQWENPDQELQPRKLFIDIETDVSADHRIISFSASEGIEKAINYIGGELYLLQQINALIDRYDYFIAWSDYDETILKKRTKKLKMKINWDKICFIDQMFVMKSTHPKFTGRSFIKIDEVGERLCGIKKKPMPKGLMWYYNNDPEIFIQYNNHDVDLQVMIEKATGCLAGWFYALEFLGLPPSYATYVSALPRVYTLRKLQHEREKRIIIPNGRKEVKDVSPFRGATVSSGDELYCGVFKSVFAMDLKGSYVSIIRDYNISPEAWNSSTGKFEGKGVFPEMIIETTNFRDHFKKQRKKYSKGSKDYDRYDAMQYGMKVVSLLFYGELGRTGSPFYIKEVAQYITDRGRDHIHVAEKALDEHFPVTRLYRDTDSVYWKFNFDTNWDLVSVKKIFDNVIKIVNNQLAIYQDSMGVPADRRTSTMEPQAYYDAVLWGGIAKNYMYYERYTADNDEWHDYPLWGVKGWVKGSNGQLALDLQHFVGRMLLDGVPVNEIITYIKHIRSGVINGEYTTHLILHKGLSKKLDEYTGGAVTFIIRAALKARDEGKYSDYMPVDYLITEINKGEITAKLVHEGVLPAVKKSGLLYMWERYVFTALVAVLVAGGIDRKTLDFLINQSGKILTGFFNG